MSTLIKITAKRRQAVKRVFRHANVVWCLRRYGTLSSSELAHLLGLKTGAMNQWMIGGQSTFNDWVRMPNGHWILLDEEPIEKEFPPLQIPRHRRSVATTHDTSLVSF